MKYIDADKIRAEIERRKKENMYVDLPMSIGRYYEDRDLLSFLDTIEEPEQPTMGYDEAYLNEKIAKANKSWEGVDVDKFMDEVRGREPVSDDLEEEVKRYYSENFSYITSDNPTLSILTNIARHFAEWGAEHLADASKMISEGLEDCLELNEAAEKFARLYDNGTCDGIAQDCFKAGAEWQKAKMMEDKQ